MTNADDFNRKNASDTGQSDTDTDSTADAQTQSELLQSMKDLLLEIQEKTQFTEGTLSHQIEVKDELINKLHGELELYRQGAEERFSDQLMRAVIKVRRDMVRRLQSDEWTDLSAEDIRREYQYVFEDITDLLEQQNVDAYQSGPGHQFDPARHQAKVVPTDDPALDKKIWKSLSEGYTKGSKVLQPERVIVYQYKQ